MQVNYWAVLVSGIVFFILGFLWYSLLFGKAWLKELESHGIKFKKPKKSEMIKKLIINLIANFVIVLALACFISMTNPITLMSALKIGLTTGIGFIAAAIAIVYTWQNQSLKLYLIDVGYQFVGVIIAAVILGCWR